MTELLGGSVLITGGTGSFGYEFVSHALRHNLFERVVVYSRDEMKQWEMREFFEGDARVIFKVGDIRDKDALARCFRGIDFAVHAAAMKIVSTAEANPYECIRTNIEGSINVIEAARESGVKKVVALSTDKACSPVNLYGATKLAADKLFVAARDSNITRNSFATKYAVVRYGNVICSRGSVIPFFIKSGQRGTLPITHGEMTRFLISLKEGVEFVLHALKTLEGGEIFVKKLPSCRIVDLALAIAPEADQEIVGIRPGEKIHEQMIATEDARYTVDCGDFYKIYPDLHTNKKLTSPVEVPVPDDFSYDSLKNPHKLSVLDLRKILKKMKVIP